MPRCRLGQRFHAFRLLPDAANAHRVNDFAVELDPEGRRVRVGGREAVLNRREFVVMAELCAAQGQAVSHDRLLTAAWPPHTPLANLRVAIRMLRRKLEPDPEMPTLIVTVPGFGYRLAGEAASDSRSGMAQPGAPGPTRTGTPCGKRF
jgi:two-component system, OmpR family, KDP operon response regulator KdpE